MPFGIDIRVPTNTQTTLRDLIAEEFSSMAAFAKAAGISQSLVWRDAQGRQISDPRFEKYLRVLSDDGRTRLAKARIRDLLGKNFESLLDVPASPGRKAESSLSLLSSRSREALEKLAREMASDNDLDDWVRKFVQRVC